MFSRILVYMLFLHKYKNEAILKLKNKYLCENYNNNRTLSALLLN